MKPAEVVRTIERQGVSPLYALIGEEDFLRDEALGAITRAALGEEGTGGFNCDLFYGDECAAAEVLTCAQEVPVFAERRLVVLKAAEKLPARETERLQAYLQDPNPTTTLVLSATKLDGRLKFTQQLKSKAQVIDCGPLPPAQVPAWIREQAAEVGVDLADDAVQALGELAGHSLSLVRRELEKVAASVPAGTVARAGDVEALRGVEPGASVFDLSAAIVAGDHGRALRIARRNLEAGEAPLRILGSLLWQFRRLWKARALLTERRPEAEIGRALGIPPFRAREFLAQARLLSDGHLRAALPLFLEADDALKGGTAAPPPRTLEWLLLRLCDGDRGAGAPSGPPPARTDTAVRKTRPIQTVRTIRTGVRRSS